MVKMSRGVVSMKRLGTVEKEQSFVYMKVEKQQINSKSMPKVAKNGQNCNVKLLTRDLGKLLQKYHI